LGWACGVCWWCREGCVVGEGGDGEAERACRWLGVGVRAAVGAAGVLLDFVALVLVSSGRAVR
jgi:hypothetical protein